MTQTQLEALRPELDAWNARQERAREEHAAYPLAFAADGICQRRACPNKSDRHRLCWSHRDQIKPLRKAAA